MITFRAAQESDLAAVAALDDAVTEMHRQAWPHLFDLTDKTEFDLSGWVRKSTAPDSTVIVAESQGQVIGFVQVKLFDEQRPPLKAMKFAAVPALAVSEAHRNQGIGSTLMVQAEEWALAKGAEEVRLTVWAFNESAAKLYSRLGYQARTWALGKRLSPSEA